LRLLNAEIELGAQWRPRGNAKQPPTDRSNGFRICRMQVAIVNDDQFSERIRLLAIAGQRK
jgi:hypothetical protein